MLRFSIRKKEMTRMKAIKREIEIVSHLLEVWETRLKISLPRSSPGKVTVSRQKRPISFNLKNMILRRKLSIKCLNR